MAGPSLPSRRRRGQSRSRPPKAAGGDPGLRELRPKESQKLSLEPDVSDAAQVLILAAVQEYVRDPTWLARVRDGLAKEFMEMATAQAARGAVRVGDVLVDVGRRVVEVGGRPVRRLGAGAWSLLTRLLSDPRPVTVQEYRRMQLIGTHGDDMGAALRQAVRRLRAKTRLPIEAHPGGLGYYLAAPVVSELA